MPQASSLIPTHRIDVPPHSRPGAYHTAPLQKPLATVFLISGQICRGFFVAVIQRCFVLRMRRFFPEAAADTNKIKKNFPYPLDKTRKML
jgi:hypothetical protein